MDGFYFNLYIFLIPEHSLMAAFPCLIDEPSGIFQRETSHDFQFLFFFSFFFLLASHCTQFCLTWYKHGHEMCILHVFVLQIRLLLFFFHVRKKHLFKSTRRLRQLNLLRERECEKRRLERRRINEFLPLSVAQFSYYIYIVEEKTESFDLNTEQR